MVVPIDGMTFDLDATLVEEDCPSRHVSADAFDRTSDEPFFSVEGYEVRYFEFPDEDVLDPREHCLATTPIPNPSPDRVSGVLRGHRPATAAITGSLTRRASRP